MEHGGGGGGGGAPTGCYKCGRPGHWSRDCPVNPNSDSNDNLKGNSKESDYNSKTATSYSSFKKKVVIEKEKPKRLPRSRPKLTPELLLSNDGLGHILRHFPRAFKYHGRGHEVNDLKNLLGLYAEWHSKLIPYYSFDQFVHKVEQVGTSKRVKRCIRELREKVTSGLDPAKLHETQIQKENTSHEQDPHDTQEDTLAGEGSSLQCPDKDNLEENMLNEVWEQAIEDPPEPSKDPRNGGEAYSGGNKEPLPKPHSTCSAVVIPEEQLQDSPEPSHDPSNGGEAYSGGNKEPLLKPNSTCSAVVIPEEQRARMEANRLKALERAAARKQSLKLP